MDEYLIKDGAMEKTVEKFAICLDESDNSRTSSESEVAHPLAYGDCDSDL